MACNLIKLRTELLNELNNLLNLKQISPKQYEASKKQIESSVYAMRMNSKMNLFEQDALNKKLNELTMYDYSNPSELTNHSGGAIGADTAFNTIGTALGFVDQNHYYHGQKTPSGNTEISEEVFKEGRVQATAAAKRNYGYDNKALISNDLTVRNWAQVKNASAIYAISTIVDTGETIMPDQKGDTRKAIAPSVTGGTGGAVGMAINNDKKVYVYNQKQISEKYPVGWYEYNKEQNDFIPTETPVLSKNYAGIGTRNLNDAGTQAIKDLYENTLKNMKSNKSKTPGSKVQNKNKIDTNKNINIYSTDKNGYEDLSNLSPREFTFDGHQYHSVEHAYQTLKSGTFNQKVDKAYNKRFEAGATLGKINGGEVDVTKSEQLMKDLIKTSLEQNPKLKELLLSTGNANLTHTQEKSNWGKLFPKIMMEVRSELSLNQNENKSQNKKNKIKEPDVSNDLFSTGSDENADAYRNKEVEVTPSYELTNYLDSLSYEHKQQLLESKSIDKDEYNKGGYTSNDVMTRDGYNTSSVDEDVSAGRFNDSQGNSYENRSSAVFGSDTNKSLQKFVKDYIKSGKSTVASDLINKEDVEKFINRNEDHTSEFGSHPNEFASDNSGDELVKRYEDVDIHANLDVLMNAFNYESVENQSVSPEYKQFFENMKTMMAGVYAQMGSAKSVNIEILKTNDEFTNMTYSENLYEDGNAFTSETGVNAISGGTITIRYGRGFYPVGVDENGNPITKQGTEDTALSDFNSHREMLMHEVLHSAIEKAFEFDPKFKQNVIDLQSMFKKKITKESLVKTLKEIKGDNVKASDDSLYRQAEIIAGYINGKPNEFMTYALSNATVFEILRKASMESKLINDMNRSENESRFVKIAQKFIDIINKVYSTLKHGRTNPIAELGKLLQDAVIADVILSNMSVADRQAKMQNKEQQFDSYEILGLSEKYKNLDEKFKRFNAKTFDKILSMNNQYKPGEKIEKFASWMNRFEFIKDSREKGRFRFFSDLINTIVEDTTNKKTGSAEFYELYRKIKGNRDRDKVELAQVAKNNIDKLWSGSAMTKEERQAATYMLQGDWRALDTDLDGLVDLLSDSTSLQNSINVLKAEIGNSYAVNDAKHLGYYSIYRTSKTGNLKRNAQMIYEDNMLNHENSNQDGRLDYTMVQKIDMLASMYSLQYMNQETKDGIISAIKKDKEVVQTTSNMYYSYRDSQNEKFRKSGLGKYVDKGLIRYGSEVDMKVEILPESQIIRAKSESSLIGHRVIGEVEAVSQAAIDIKSDDKNRGAVTGEKYFLVMSRDFGPSRTQGGYDDIRLVDNGISLKHTLGLDNIDDFKDDEKDFYNSMKYFKDRSNPVNRIDDNPESMFALRDQIVPSYDIYGNVADYEIPVSDYEQRTYGRKSVDIADTVSSTISHINSKEQAISNNAMFTRYLVEDSIKNAGKPGYVLLRPSTKKEISRGIRHKYDEEWAMIPNYIQEMIMARDEKGNPTREGLWVKEGRINNIIGYKDVSLANLKLFGKSLDKHPEIKKTVEMLEYFFKNLAGRYKEHIVKLFPVVVFGNAASNLFTAMRHGIGPQEYYKSFTKNWVDLTKYLEINEKLVGLELMQKGGKKGLSYEIASLKEQLSKNGFHGLIQDGQFSTIMEDLNTNESLSHRNHFDDLIKQKVDNSSKFVQNAKDVWDTLYIGKGTRLHHAVEKLTIYNDIINKRIIEEKLNQDLDSLNLEPEIRALREQDNRNYLDQLFVNYSYLDNKYLKYMNDINLFMFTKYMFRALKGNLAMMSRYPLGSLGFEAFDNTILNVPDAMQQYFNPITSMANRAFANPIEMFLDMLIPHSLGIVVGH